MIIKPSAKPLVAFCVFECLITFAVITAAVYYFPDYLTYTVGAVVLLSGLLLVPRVIRFKSTQITIGEGRLHYESGVLSKVSRTMELSKVQDVRVDQTLGQRILGMGDLALETAGETSRITMAGIDRPREAADYILQLSRSKNATA
jgi:membrane protein YdbS with pleckstrin-like domain